ncbi:MAG: polysaccharide pyruvyl transferase family protein [Christensenellales bacterium]
MNILLYNHSGCENRGCEAIVRSTSALFAQAGAHVSVTSGQAELDRKLNLPDVARLLDEQISPYSVSRLVNSIGFRLGMPREHEVARKYLPVIREGRRADVCLSVGGDTYCYAPQEHIRVINGRLRRADKPLVLWGCSVNPERLEGECLNDLKAYDLVVARESITAQAMRDAGMNVRMWCDPAFTMAAEELPLPTGWKEKQTVGLNVSPLVLSHAKDKEAALNAFVSLVRHILRTSDRAVALIPHVTWAHDNDMDALSAIKAHFADEPRVFILSDRLNAMQYKGYVKRLCGLVTARTHVSVAAYSTFVPTLVIGYSVKARGIARDLFGSEEGHLIPAQELSGETELIAAYDALMRRGDAEREQLKARMPSYMAGREETIAAVLALAGGKRE